jgi:hypothetical protein
MYYKYVNESNNNTVNNTHLIHPYDDKRIEERRNKESIISKMLQLEGIIEH